MNLVYLSPHFPSNHYLYCLNLRRLGAKVLGIGDQPWGELLPEQREALTEYYRVDHLENHDAVRGAVDHFIREHGPIDRIDSHNEYWLMLEATLRSDFGIQGSTPEQIEEGRRKSRIKEHFRRAGVPVARGTLATTTEEARQFIDEVGYPVVAKPDVGVGATATYKLENQDELRRFFETKSKTDYFFEEFVRGSIVTFDGLTDPDGRIVYFASMEYSSGVMEAVNNDQDIYYFTHRVIPEDLQEAGSRTVREFEIRERFFHIEFFRTERSGVIGLEVNLRPPGGPSIDMFNYSSDVDLYKAWAEVMVWHRTDLRADRPYHCCFVGRKRNIHYRYSHEAALARAGISLIHHTPIPEIFRNAMGDHAYLVRTRTLDELRPLVEFMQERA